MSNNCSTKKIMVILNYVFVYKYLENHMAIHVNLIIVNS